MMESTQKIRRARSIIISDLTVARQHENRSITIENLPPILDNLPHPPIKIVSFTMLCAQNLDTQRAVRLQYFNICQNRLEHSLIPPSYFNGDNNLPVDQT